MWSVAAGVRPTRQAPEFAGRSAIVGLAQNVTAMRNERTIAEQAVRRAPCAVCRVPCDVWRPTRLGSTAEPFPGRILTNLIGFIGMIRDPERLEQYMMTDTILPGVGTRSAPRLGAVHGNVLDLVGNTPVVDVSNLSPNPDVRLIAKLEMQNPWGSVKDRIAKAMIEAAEKDGSLQPGQTIIEPSSGNTGIALAAIARLKGYPIKILLPESVSIERRQMLEIMGAEIILTPGAEGSNGAVRRAELLAAEHPEWRLIYQYGNDANPRAHYEGTGPEIWRDVPEITHFVAGLGTSGTLMGTGRFLKEQNPDIQIIAVEPPLGERVEGLRNMDEGYIPPVFENWNGFELLDRKRVVRPRESIEWTRRLVNECGIFAGLSTGAALAGAAKVASSIPRGESATIVFIVCDGGWKYLSTGAYTADLDVAEQNAEAIIYF